MIAFLSGVVVGLIIGGLVGFTHRGTGDGSVGCVRAYRSHWTEGFRWRYVRPSDVSRRSEGLKPASGRSNESDPVAGSPGHWRLAKGAGSVAGVMMAGPVPLLGRALIPSLLILTGDGSNGKVSRPQVEFSFPAAWQRRGRLLGRSPLPV